MTFSFGPMIAAHPFETWNACAPERPAWPMAINKITEAGPGDAIGLQYRLVNHDIEAEAPQVGMLCAAHEPIPDIRPPGTLVGYKKHEDALRLRLALLDEDPVATFTKHPDLDAILHAWQKDIATGSTRLKKRSLWIFRSTALLMPWHKHDERRRPSVRSSEGTRQVHLFHAPASTKHEAMALLPEIFATIDIATQLLARSGEALEEPPVPVPAAFRAQNNRRIRQSV